MEVTSEAQLAEALDSARRAGLPWRLIGGGSNVVPVDYLPGLTLQMKIAGVSREPAAEGRVLLDVGGGESWPELAWSTAAQGLYGLENLVLIPGTAGAAPIQNIGAYGAELGDILQSVRVLDVRTMQVKFLTADKLKLAYRHSLFKEDGGRHFVITRIRVQLEEQADLRLEYADLRERWEKAGAVKHPLEVAKIVRDLRLKKLPDPAKVPNAGSFFKNPLVHDETYQRLLEQDPGLVAFPLQNGQWKLAAGWLIEAVGWKGQLSPTGVGTHDRQALVLVNPGKAPGSEVLHVAGQIRAAVKHRFGICLEQEPGNLS